MNPPSRERLSIPFVALLVALFLAPLPMGGAGSWALALIGLSIMAVLILHLWLPDASAALQQGRSGGVSPWRRARLPFGLMAAWTGLLAFQLLPLPAAWISALDFNPADGLPVIVGAWAPISVDPYATRLYLLQALVLLAFFGLVLRLATTRRRVELLVWTVVFCGAFQATVGLALFANGASYTLMFGVVDHNVAKGSFFNRNHFAGYLEMTLAIGIGLMIAKLADSRPRTWKQRLQAWLTALLSDKAWLRIMLIVMVVGLISSRSRMGNGAFMISLLVTGITAIALARQAPRAMVVFLVSIVVLDVVIMGSVVGLDTVARRIEETNLRILPEAVVSTDASGGAVASASSHQEQSLEQRLEVAQLSTAIIRDFRLFGTGGGTYAIAFPPYQPPHLTGFFEHAHNDFTEFATETGLVGLAMLAATVVHSATRALRILMRRREQFARGIAFGALMGMVTILIHSIVDFNLQLPANAMTFLIVLALPYLVANDVAVGRSK